MKLSFCGARFIMHASGALLWPDEDMVIASDLHLEKGSHFAKRGYYLPPYDSRRTLERLLDVMAATGHKRLLLLGDCFHDPKGLARLPADERSAFDTLIKHETIWISGNHDGDCVPEGLTSHAAITIRGLTFRHEAAQDGEAEISGHFHPKADIVIKGEKLSRPCFAENGQRLILPAFGAYTGGLSLDSPALLKVLGPAPRAYLLGNKVYRLAA